MSFAQRAQASIGPTAKEIEDKVRNTLVSAGFEPQTQVGGSGFVVCAEPSITANGKFVCKVGQVWSRGMSLRGETLAATRRLLDGYNDALRAAFPDKNIVMWCQGRDGRVSFMF